MYSGSILTNNLSGPVIMLESVITVGESDPPLPKHPRDDLIIRRTSISVIGDKYRFFYVSGSSFVKLNSVIGLHCLLFSVCGGMKNCLEKNVKYFIEF